MICLPSSLFIFKDLFIFNLYVWSFTCIMSVCHRGHNRISDLLELELHMIVSHPVASEIGTWVPSGRAVCVCITPGPSLQPLVALS